MNFVFGLSAVEAAVLAVLVLLCLAAAWAMYRKMTGRATSDVSGLRLGGNRGEARVS